MKIAEIVYRIDLREEKYGISNQPKITSEHYDLIAVEEDTTGNPTRFLATDGVWRDLTGAQVVYHPKHYFSARATTPTGGLRFLKNGDLFRGQERPSMEKITFALREGKTFILEGDVAEQLYPEARTTWLKARGRQFENEVDYEIYPTRKGCRVNIGDASYPLEVLDFSKAKHSFNVGAEWDEGSIDGLKGDLGKWFHAAMDVEVPLRYAWSGVMNSLGHTGSVSIPWKGRERDYERDDQAPIPDHNWKIWIEWRHQQWAEYTIGSPRKTQWLHAYNAQGQVIEQLQQIQCRMATNTPIVANTICERDYLVVSSREDLHGQAIPCLHPYYSKSRKYPEEEEHSLIACLTGQEETYQMLVTALEERFEEFSISPLQDPASGPYVHLHLWHGPKGEEHTECQNKINELVQQGLIWRTDMMGVHQRTNPHSKRK